MAATRTTALCQLVAARKHVQAETHGAITDLHRQSQKAQLLTGFSRTYRKINDADADVPGEKQLVQLHHYQVLEQVAEQLRRRWDVTAAVDWTNCVARADVVVDDEVVLPDAPVPFLIYLEKQLDNFHTIVDKLPVQDPAERWRWDGNAGAFVTDPAVTVRTKKEPKNHVLAPATDKHPAQVQMFTEDVPVGYWDTVKYSGAIPGDHRAEILDRLSQLRQAVKMAREKANQTDGQNPKPATRILAHLLAGYIGRTAGP